MHKLAKIALGGASTLALSLVALVVYAGGWDNFKLRYFHLGAAIHNQELALTDLRQRQIQPEQLSRINLSELLHGGPPKDGIPSIDNPQFDTAKTTPFSQNEIVIGVVVNGEAKAYPYGIMNWHELVNDTVGGINLAVSYCPLCDTSVAFKRGNTTFGVSGKLYQSCLVMYDRADDTLYSQPWAVGVVGSQVNHTLERIPLVKTTLGNWLAKYPKSKVLSVKTGHRRNYYDYPYGSYYTDGHLVFPVRNQNNLNLHPKTPISYIWEADAATPENRFSGSSQRFVHTELEKVGEQIVEFKGRQVKAIWDDSLETVIVEEMDGTPIPSSTAFAFVYPAFFGK